MRHPTANLARQVALRKLGRLFARLDDAVTRGELDEAKTLLVDVRAALAVARESELGAPNLNPSSDDVDSR
jgi:hypothetical protein